ncbi:MAG: isopentenyl phosphate kinase [Nitrososphaerota archaeon]|nr:isopentenyl phosphate kinase family protein [Candidatus Aenigmarchaeota archaeon]
MKNLIILKLGGSVITDKKSEIPKVNYEVVERLAREIFEAYSSNKFKLILIHGAGSYGHQIVKKTGIDKGIKTKEQIVAFAETQRLQNELNSIITKIMIDKGLPTIPCQASSHAVMKSGRLIKMDIRVIKGLLKIGLIPVLYGVPAFDIEQKCSILSGDQIAPYLAKALKANKIIHGTNVNGIYTSDPNLDKNAIHIPEISEGNIDEVKKYLSGSSTVDVTGGMLGKVLETLEVAISYGIPTQIVNALDPNNIKLALLGEKIGTIIHK